MLNRRFLRIKVLQVLYAHSAKREQGVEAAHKELRESIQRTHDLFFYLLLLYAEVLKKTEELIEIRRNKLTADIEERMPNMRFVENEFAQTLKQHENFRREVSNKQLSWLKDREVVSKLSRDLLDSEDYQAYIKEENPSFESDKRFVKHFFEVVLYNSEELYTTLEEKDIYWINDIDFIIKKIASFIDRVQERKNETLVFPAVYKKDDDRTFARDLLMKAILNRNAYEEIIEKQIVNWDIERVTRTDRLILLLAITEVIGFSSIPIKVSINEYIEISKMYSSPKNAKFVNGVLDKTVNYLKENELFNKTGRGLVE
jgi:transcription antitermination protein NusB